MSEIDSALQAMQALAMLRQTAVDARIDVLDHGYVRLVDISGNDTRIANAAWASYVKGVPEYSPPDERVLRLIRFLASSDPVHESPFRHAVLHWEIKAPMMVARQWFKYRIGCKHGPDTAGLIGVDIPTEVAEWLGLAGDDAGFSDLMYARNEASRRYLTLMPEFYVPRADGWRSKPANGKQGSGQPLPADRGAVWTERLIFHIEQSVREYEAALADGICAEQARLFLPSYSLYTSWRWTCSLQAVAHYLVQRLDDAAQREIQEYARAVYRLALPLFEAGLGHLMGLKREEGR